MTGDAHSEFEAFFDTSATWTIVRGDCREVLKLIPDQSVDGIVCDPPYELKSGKGSSSGFMGQRWDASGIAFDVAVWREVLRILKPGAHLAACGGPRTWHRLVCAIEDAGFEIRDSVDWLYGSAPAHGLDPSKAIDRRRDDRPAILAVTKWLGERAREAGVSNAEIDARFGFSGMAGHWTSQGSQPAVPTWEQWCYLKRIVGCGDEMDDEVRRLNERKGEPGEAWSQREVIGHREDGAGNTGREAVPLASPGSTAFDVTAPATDEARRWEGFSTKLKPGHEPIVIARRPLVGTVVENLERYSTGVLNVDACRVATDWNEPDRPDSWKRSGHSAKPDAEKIAAPPGTGINCHPGGRYPPNVILTHSADCRRLGVSRVAANSPAVPNPALGSSTGAVYGYRYGEGRDGTMSRGYADEDGRVPVPVYDCALDCPVAELARQSGKSRSNASRKGPRQGIVYNAATAAPGPDGIRGHSDSGDASRFFPQLEWCAEDVTPFFYGSKASTREREAGGRAAEPGERWNRHPTVKPIALMRWLCRLIVPPGGIIVDPFAGSGTTVIAGGLEGFRVLGIDLSLEYVHLARARIAYCLGKHTEARVDDQDDDQDDDDGPGQRELF